MAEKTDHFIGIYSEIALWSASWVEEVWEQSISRNNNSPLARRKHYSPKLYALPGLTTVAPFAGGRETYLIPGR